MIRYADDFVLVFEQESDAQRVYRILPKRLARFGLEVAPEKTRIFRFEPQAKHRFEFLGFEFGWSKGRWSKPTLKRRTARKKYRASLANIKQWCQEHCRLPIPELMTRLNRKLQGYWNYYGIRGNFESISDYFYQVRNILFNVLNRRSQRKSYTWASYTELLKGFPLAKPRIVHAF